MGSNLLIQMAVVIYQGYRAMGSSRLFRDAGLAAFLDRVSGKRVQLPLSNLNLKGTRLQFQLQRDSEGIRIIESILQEFLKDGDFTYDPIRERLGLQRFGLERFNCRPSDKLPIEIQKEFGQNLVFLVHIFLLFYFYLRCSKTYSSGRV